MSIAWSFGNETFAPEASTLEVAGFPGPQHPAESDLFCRQASMPGHSQSALTDAHVGVVGCGGLGSWTALALARSGVGQLTLIDRDRFDRTNAPRQLMFSRDLGQLKSLSLARNIGGHMTAAGEIRAVALTFQDAVDAGYLSKLTTLAVLVDNNRTRFQASAFARRVKIPAVFGMLSRDGLRTHVFVQDLLGPCLSCALPNLDADSAAPCAAASIVSCLLCTTHVTYALHRLLMKPCTSVRGWTWRECDLAGVAPDRTGAIVQRPSCPVCGDQTAN